MKSSSQHLPRALIQSLVLIWIVLFLIGLYGHLQLGNPIRDSLFKSLQLFHLHYHPYPESSMSYLPGAQVPDEGQAGHANVGWALEGARFGCALWGLAILPLVVGFLFERRLHQWWVGCFWKGHYVVCGTCSRTRALVADLQSKGCRVVWVGRYPDERYSAPPGVLHVDGDSGDVSTLAITVVHRASHLVALHEDDRLNIETLVAAGKLCAKRPDGMGPLDSYAHVTDTRLEQVLQNLIKAGTGFTGSNVRAHLFNFYELIARLLVRRFPIPPTLAESRPSPEHIVIVGFAAFGQCAALRILLMTQQLYRQQEAGGPEWHVAKPRITVVDPHAEARVAEFDRYHPTFRQYCNLDYCSIATTDFRFCDQPFFTSRVPGERKTLIFCIETEAETMRILGLIAHMMAGGMAPSCAIDRVCIRLAQPERLGPVLDQMKPPGDRPEIVYFAPDTEVFNADVILNQNLDLLAREIHKAYLSVEAADRRANNQPPAAGRSWADLAEDDRESNREAADHLWAKLHVLGYTLAEVAEGNPVPPPSVDLLGEIESREEEMAHAEHYRWMTWRILNDWHWGAPRDNLKKLHPDICDYDTLAESTKEKDRINIRIIPELLKQGRLTASRRHTRGHKIDA